MANNKNYWVVGSKNGWAVKREGGGRNTSVHRTQAEAWSVAQSFARESRGEAILQGASGKIRERNSYDSDPSGRR